MWGACLMIRMMWRSVGFHRERGGGHRSWDRAGTRMDVDTQNLAADGVVTARVPGGTVGS